MLEAAAAATATAGIDVDKIIDRGGPVGTGVGIDRRISVRNSAVRNVRHARNTRRTKENHEKSSDQKEHRRYPAKYGVSARVGNLNRGHSPLIIHPKRDFEKQKEWIRGQARSFPAPGTTDIIHA